MESETMDLGPMESEAVESETVKLQAVVPEIGSESVYSSI